MKSTPLKTLLVAMVFGVLLALPSMSQAGYQEATEALKRLVGDGPVRLEF